MPHTIWLLIFVMAVSFYLRCSLNFSISVIVKIACIPIKFSKKKSTKRYKIKSDLLPITLT